MDRREEGTDRDSFRRRLGAVIREARKRLGMRQEDLARAAGFQHVQTVSDIERGLREVHAFELLRIANAVGVRVTDLLAGWLPGRPAVLWRAAPGSEELKAAHEARFLQYCRDYRWLEEQLRAVPEQRLPSFSLASIKNVWGASALGEKTAAMLSLGSRPATSLAAVLEEDYGVKFWYADLQEGSGACCVSEEFGYAVLLNRNEAPWRRNFSLAHELFHLITWPGPAAGTGRCERTPAPSEETLANAFAAALLLPEAQVRHELQQRARDGRIHLAELISLARSYGVSTEALLWRMVSMELLGEARVRELLADPSFRELDKRARRGDWGEAPVRSERFARLAIQAWFEGKVSTARLAELLDVPLAAVEEEVIRHGFPEQLEAHGEPEPSIEVSAP